MKWRSIGGLVLLAVAAALGQSGTVPSGADDYRDLYEQGYYDEAIGMLDSLVLLDTASDREKLYYLAACLIARGDRERGAVVFEWILAGDPSYSLDTLYTPPKILEVFREVQVRCAQLQVATAVVDPAGDTATPAAPGAPGSAAVTAVSGNDVPGLPVAADSAVPVRDARLSRLRAALRIGPGLLPCGTGQFLQRKPVRGVLLCAAQAASLGVCIWAFRTREDHFDPAYGWYAGNRTDYNRYTGYTWAGAGLLLGSYTLGVIDYFYPVFSPRIGK